MDNSELLKYALRRRHYLVAMWLMLQQRWFVRSFNSSARVVSWLVIALGMALVTFTVVTLSRNVVPVLTTPGTAPYLLLQLLVLIVAFNIYVNYLCATAFSRRIGKAPADYIYRDPYNPNAQAVPHDDSDSDAVSTDTSSEEPGREESTGTHTGAAVGAESEHGHYQSSQFATHGSSSTHLASGHDRARVSTTNASHTAATPQPFAGIQVVRVFGPGVSDASSRPRAAAEDEDEEGEEGKGSDIGTGVHIPQYPPRPSASARGTRQRACSCCCWGEVGEEDDADNSDAEEIRSRRDDDEGHHHRPAAGSSRTSTSRGGCPRLLQQCARRLCPWCPNASPLRGYFSWPMLRTLLCLPLPFLSIVCRRFLTALARLAPAALTTTTTTVPPELLRELEGLAFAAERFSPRQRAVRVLDAPRRYCGQCRRLKAPREHHCAICNQCVSKMDHHCPWINNCVDVENARYFLLFVAWLWLGTLLTSAFLGYGVVRQHRYDSRRTQLYRQWMRAPVKAALTRELQRLQMPYGPSGVLLTSYPSIMVLGIAITMFVCMTFFVYFNRRLVLENTTVIESIYVDDKRKHVYRSTGFAYRNPYDLGLWYNLVDLLTPAGDPLVRRELEATQRDVARAAALPSAVGAPARGSGGVAGWVSALRDVASWPASAAARRVWLLLWLVGFPTLRPTHSDGVHYATFDALASGELSTPLRS